MGHLHRDSDPSPISLYGAQLVPGPTAPWRPLLPRLRRIFISPLSLRILIKMPSLSVLAVALQVLGLCALASGFDLVQGLNDCFTDCLAKTSDGCDSQSCLCDASQSASYLSSAVSCIASTCDVDDWTINLLFLGPLQMYCGAVGNPIPETIMSGAYVACTSTKAAPQPTTRKAEHSTKPTEHKTTKGADLRSAVSSTIIKTTTDKDGNTLLLMVPIVIGPHTAIETGRIITSTVENEPSITSTPAASSVPASPSSAAETAAPRTTQPPPAPPAEPTQRTGEGNGSPFENMQAGATQWRFSGALVGLGALAGIFMRL
ncbi:hypothetical protein BDV95DRAFT_611357 [Massariosphaeria phaeospora]|uniref:Extracellular membrane protein CFEM domain-containing protein n=1 Tax=Massariosphaeria phaeospora TaxID=100035 RepID=A0A7C8M2F7_9PLEO|nr:hypothetical protein BDV95DRAFT_611357 [Massariosphaeria phaeospora]